MVRRTRLAALALVGFVGCSGSTGSKQAPAGNSSSTGSPTSGGSGGGSDSVAAPASGGPSAPGGGGTGGTGFGSAGGGGSGGGSGAGGSAAGSTGSAPPMAGPLLPGSGGSGSGGFAGGGFPGGGGAGAISGRGVGAGGDGGVTSIVPGTLTAGLWDDSLNYDFFGRYLAARAGIAGDPGFSQTDYQTAHTTFAGLRVHTVVDAALVIDTTGSMSDELQYLTTEFGNIWSAVSQALPNAMQRWALIAYRDRPDTDPGDEYVVKTFDFMDNAHTFSSTIGGLNAANGGDYPEAPELGLEELKTLTWRTDPSATKMAFWVGDAPHHAQHAADMKQAIADTRAAGIHMYPVSASGTDDLLEFTMRSAAELTGGRYLFLTDDSGVGDPHKIPEIPCYFVTKLTRALVRAIAMEVSGSHIGPDPAQVIRTFGDPASDGKCTTQDGQTVQIF